MLQKDSCHRTEIKLLFLINSYAMPISCAKCNVSLPDFEELTYRFCPNCGATITDEKSQAKHALDTIPPDALPRPDAEFDHEVRRYNLNQHSPKIPEHTLAPDIPKGTRRATIKPPSTPPPAVFFRETTNGLAIQSGVKEKRRKAWIWLALGVGGGVILVWWLLGI